MGQLSTQSAEFRELWASHDVIRYQRGGKQYRHPVVGDLDFGYESFDLTIEPGMTMLVYTIEPGSPTDHAMRLLASWATPHQPAEELPDAGDLPGNVRRSPADER